nr:SLC13 family permease [Algoriphagus sp.]
FEQINEPFHKQKLFKAYPVEALQILRADGRKVKVYPNTPIEKDDLIRITCEKETIQKLKKFTGLSIKSELEWSTENVTDDEVRLYEALVTPNSDLVNKKLLALNFRHIFDQITVVGIRHRAGLLEGLLKQTKLRAGDILLLRGTEDAIQRMSEGNDLLLLAENKSRNINKTQGILTVATLAVVILLSAFKVFPIAVCAIGGVVVLVLLKSINPLEAYKAID